MKCFDSRIAELMVVARDVGSKAGSITKIGEITYFGGQVQAFRVTR